jgi:NitT/TauT family transport system permease protein
MTKIRRSRRVTESAIRLSCLLSLVVIWELVTRSNLVSPVLMPSLSKIALAFWRAIQNGDLVYHGAFSLGRAMTGFMGAVAIGVPLGAIMARWHVFEATFEPLFSLSYPVPKIALYPIFIFIFGLGSGSKVALVFLECLYPITINTYLGIRRVPISLIRAGENMGTHGAKLFWKVSVPAAAPEIFSGLRIALPLALLVVILAEMIGESVGLGYYISYEAASFDFATSLAAVIAVAVMGFTLDRLLVLLRRYVIFWDRFERSDR